MERSYYYHPRCRKGFPLAPMVPVGAAPSWEPLPGRPAATCLGSPILPFPSGGQG
jgi:hypothetical protein